MELVYLSGSALLFLIYVLRRVMRFLEWSPLSAIRIKRGFYAAKREFFVNRRHGDDRRRNVIPIDFPDRRSGLDRRRAFAAA